MSFNTLNITILVDNQVNHGLIAEHGLSLWIETEGKYVLFDTGPGIALGPNARAIGVDLAKTETVVLSHGHYDHSGGVAHILRQAPMSKVYCHPQAVQPRYAIRNGTPISIRMPQNCLTALDKLPQQHLHWVQKPVLLSEQIGLTGPIPRKTMYEDTGGPFYLDPEGKRPDPIKDDLALWIRQNDGLIVLVGCCHAGLVNTLNYVRHLNSGLKIKAVIGGLHLLNAGGRRMEETITALRLFKPNLVVPCHCTGDAAVALLCDALGKSVSPGAAGLAFKF